MAAGIDRLLQDQELAQTMGAYGLRQARQHHVYEEYLDNIQKMLAEEANACAAA